MKAAEYVHLTERLAILRRDDRGGVFHLRAKLIGRAGYVYRTTDKIDLEAAKRAAFEIFYKLEALHDQGVVVGVGTFAKVYKAFERDVLVHKSDARRRQFEGAFRRYFLPFFKEAPLTSINETKIRSFWEFRINYHASEDVSARQEKASKTKRGPKAEGKLTKRRSTLQNIIKPSAATLSHDCESSSRPICLICAQSRIESTSSSSCDLPKTVDPKSPRPQSAGFLFHLEQRLSPQAGSDRRRTRHHRCP